MPYANNKGTDQPAHPRSLINAFVARCLDSIIPLVSVSEISSPYLASVVAQAVCVLSGRKPRCRFSRDMAHTVKHPKDTDGMANSINPDQIETVEVFIHFDFHQNNNGSHICGTP